MTIGKDVSSLFADVVKNMQTDDIELKKLVYLYLINYAKSQPELVILAVNTFVKVNNNYFYIIYISYIYFRLYNIISYIIPRIIYMKSKIK